MPPRALPHSHPRSLALRKTVDEVSTGTFTGFAHILHRQATRRDTLARRTVRPSAVISLNTGCRASAKTMPYPARTPVLALDFGSTSVLLTTSDSDQVSPADGGVRPAARP